MSRNSLSSSEFHPPSSPRGIVYSSLRIIATDVDGTLTDGGMYYTADGELMKRFDTRDAAGMARLEQRGFLRAIVTRENSPIVLARAKKLRIREVHVNIDDKLAFFERFLKRLELDWRNLIYVGDDLNDLPVLERAGLAACPADADYRVGRNVHYVCDRPGGYGAVREVCNLVEAALDAGAPGAS